MFCEENYITEDDSKLKNNPSNIIDTTSEAIKEFLIFFYFINHIYEGI